MARSVFDGGRYRYNTQWHKGDLVTAMYADGHWNPATVVNVTSRAFKISDGSVVRALEPNSCCGLNLNMEGDTDIFWEQDVVIKWDIPNGKEEGFKGYELFPLHSQDLQVPSVQCVPKKRSNAHWFQVVWQESTGPANRPRMGEVEGITLGEEFYSFVGTMLGKRYEEIGLFIHMNKRSNRMWPFRLIAFIFGVLPEVVTLIMIIIAGVLVRS